MAGVGTEAEKKIVKQFRGTSKPRTFYDRRVHNIGYARMIAVGRIIPRDWEYIRIEIRERDDRHVLVDIIRLGVVGLSAQANRDNKEGE